MRKVFLDELPRKGRHIHWENSINKKIKFTYDDISGEMEIIDYIKPSGVVVRFNGKELKIHSSSLALSCCTEVYLLYALGHTNNIKDLHSNT